MHTLIQQDYATAEHASRQPSGREPRLPRPEPPPGRLRAALARTLAAVAGRLDREAARRAVA